MRELAKAPNLCCKVSGMVTEAKPGQWQPEDFRPYLDVVFAAFGEDRLLFGSDWPVCLLAGTYAQVFDLLAGYLKQFPESARSKILGNNAAKFYGLNL
jgi:L-fuconolactonase